MQKKTKQQTTKMQTRVMSNSSSLDAVSWKCHIIIAVYLGVHTTHELREGSPSFFYPFLFFNCGTWSCKKVGVGFILFCSWACFIFGLLNQVVFVFLQNVQHPLCLSVFVFCPLLFFFSSFFSFSFFFFSLEEREKWKKTRLHTHAHMHACMRAHTHTHTHTHTHIQK